MADVQKAHGYLQVANELDGAIIYAPFSATQMKIVRALVRLTYGWKQRTVRISVPDLADCCNLRPLGGFRRALIELIQQGVIREIQPPSGRRAALYHVNKNFEQWGRFFVSADRLKQVFNRQRPGDDAALRALRSVTRPGDDTGDEKSDDAPGSVTAAGDSMEEQLDDSITPKGESEDAAADGLTNPPGSLSSPPWVGTMTLQGQLDPMQVSPNKDLQERKEIERKERNTTTAKATASRERGDAVQAYALAILKAAVAGIEYRWPTSIKRPKLVSAINLASDLLDQDVSIEFATTTITSVCHASRKPEPMDSVEWFRGAILDAVEATKRASNGTNGAPRTPTRAPAMSPGEQSMADADAAFAEFDALTQPDTGGGG